MVIPFTDFIFCSTLATVSLIAFVDGPLTVTSTESLPEPLPMSWFFHSPGWFIFDKWEITLSGSSSKLGVSLSYSTIIAILFVLPVGSAGDGPPTEYWTVFTLSLDCKYFCACFAWSKTAFSVSPGLGV